MDIRTVSFARAVYKPEDLPRDRRPQVAMIGRSNVGKSTLINSLIGRKGLARVSQTPGKTQAIQFYLVNERFYLVDLPGYGYAKVPREITASWGDLIRTYLESTQELKLLFLLLDARRTPSDQDLQIRDWMIERGSPWAAILTKTDKLSGNEMARSRKEIAAVAGLPSGDLIGFSKMNRKGVPEIWSAIGAALEAARAEQNS
ncbi:MAG: ribosome biogenesis GTP-binding protein YihA/YsxC [Thermoanaerobaculia bacterium]